LPSALAYSIFSSCAPTLAWLFEFLSFGFEDSFLAFSKMSEDKKAVVEMKLSPSEEKNLGFLEAMSKTNTEKITKEILEGLSEDTGDSDSYDVDSGGEDSEDRPWRPSHAVFGKSSIKENHLVNMRGRYFRDISESRLEGGCNALNLGVEFFFFFSLTKFGRYSLFSFPVCSFFPISNQYNGMCPCHV
jgi:hypothetical protein